MPTLRSPTAAQWEERGARRRAPRCATSDWLGYRVYHVNLLQATEPERAHELEWSRKSSSTSFSLLVSAPCSYSFSHLHFPLTHKHGAQTPVYFGVIAAICCWWYISLLTVSNINVKNVPLQTVRFNYNTNVMSFIMSRGEGPADTDCPLNKPHSPQRHSDDRLQSPKGLARLLACQVCPGLSVSNNTSSTHKTLWFQAFAAFVPVVSLHKDALKCRKSTKNTES